VKRLFIIAIALVVILGVFSIAYVPNLPQHLATVRFPHKILTLTLKSDHPKLGLALRSKENFDQWVDTLHLTAVDTLVLPYSRKTIPIKGFQHIHVLFAATQSAIPTPDFVSRAYDKDWETLQYRYTPSTQTLDIVVGISDVALADAAGKGKNLELLINNTILRALYLMTYQIHAKEFPTYLDFLNAYDPMETDLYVNRRTFITVIE